MTSRPTAMLLVLGSFGCAKPGLYGDFPIAHGVVTDEALATVDHFLAAQLHAERLGK